MEGTSSGLDFAVRSFPDALPAAVLPALRAQCRALVRDSKETFWIPMGAPARTPLEALALDVFAAHTAGLASGAPVDPACSGAEFWVQYKEEGAWGVGGGICLHYDKDEGLAEAYHVGVFPQLSTVTYLDDTLRAAPPTVVMEHTMGDADEALITTAWVSHPRPGKHIVFDGRFLHGVPALAEVREGASAAAAAPALRTTFLCNVWLNHVPAGVERLSEATVTALNAHWGADAPAGSLLRPPLSLVRDAALPTRVRVSGAAVDGGAFVRVSLPFIAASEDADETTVSLVMPSAEWWGAGAGGGSSAGGGGGRSEDKVTDPSTYCFAYGSAKTAGSLVVTDAALSDDGDGCGGQEGGV